MSFNPKLVHRDDDEAPLAEADWPDDLALLAGQLQADAARLAASYPAEPSAPRGATVEHSPPRGAWPRRLGVLAAAVAVVLCAPLGRSGPNESRTVHPPAQPRVVAPPVTPSVFRALTGPEQEALLDLMESQRLEQASLTI